MGGVGLADNGIANYRICIKGKKWYWPLFVNFISMCVVNSWKSHQLTSKTPVDLLEHTRIIVCKLITMKKATNTSRNLKISNMIKANSCSNPIIKNDESSKRLRCAVCPKITVYYCIGCSTRLHTNFFSQIS